MASKLLRTAAHEAENQTELSLREAFVLLQHQLKPPFSLKIPSPSEYKQLNRAILFGLLTEPHMARIHITYLHAIVTDGYAFFVDLLLKISNELYPKLLESVRVQLLWIVSKMVDVLALGIDVLLISLLRQIVGGDLSFGLNADSSSVKAYIRVSGTYFPPNFPNLPKASGLCNIEELSSFSI